MNKEEWRRYIKKAKDDYKQIGSITCPAFNNEKVLFNNSGFDHIIYKDKRRRAKDEIIERLNLIMEVPSLLKIVKTVHSIRESIRGDTHATFWELRIKNSKKQTICIIIRKLGNNAPHFFSIFTK